MLGKIKILTKIKDFNGVQKSLQDIESKLNMLKESVNKPAELELSETQGKTGDLSAERNADNSYRMRIRTKRGWENPVLKPHYDSGWTSIVDNKQGDNAYSFNHHLGSKLLLLQIYFKITEDAGDVKIGDIFNLNNTGIIAYEVGDSGHLTGINVEMASNNTIRLHTANQFIFGSDTGSQQEHDQGDIRIFAWKIGVSL